MNTKMWCWHAQKTSNMVVNVLRNKGATQIVKVTWCEAMKNCEARQKGKCLITLQTEIEGKFP